MKAAIAFLALWIPLAAAAENCFNPGSYRSSDPIAEQNLQTGMAYFGEKQYAAALHYLADAAQRNHPRAQELMGQMYQFGYGVKRDSRTALQYFSAAAAQGHRSAIADLGFYYSEVEIDLSKADQYFLTAAQCGLLEAQVELGFNYEFARGVAWDRRQAIYWLLQAAPHWGQAGFVAEWLQNPRTPHFQSADELGRYISAQIGRNIALSIPSHPGFAPTCIVGRDGHCHSTDGAPLN